MASSAAPLMTVITPTYNRADFLRETIESVLAQNYPALDYLVIDDGSTDRTRDLLAEYRGRLRWETQANTGESSAVNRGLALAKGDLIAVVNSDDPVLPGWLRAMADFMDAHPDLIAAYPDWHKIDSRSRPISPAYQREYDYTKMLREDICLVGPGAVFRRSIAATIQRDPALRYVGDFDFWLRAGLLGEIARVPQTLATFRVHDSSTSEGGRGLAMAAETEQIIARLFDRPDLPPEVSAIRAQSLSTASYMAAAHALRESQPAARRYFLRSIRQSPIETIRRPKRLAYALATLLLPSAAHRALFRLWKQMDGR